MSLLICVSDTMFAQCCDKGNCHFSELGQKRFYRIAYLTFHISYFLSKIHSFIHLCVCAGECMSICVWLYAPVCMQRRQKRESGIFFQSSPVSLNQGLSLNLGLAFS